MRCSPNTVLFVTAAAALLYIVSSKDTPLVQANSKFALKVYRYMASDHKNVVYSPFSISASMAMLYGGATGATAIELAKALQYTKVGSSVHRRFKKLLKKFGGGNYTMTLANQIFINRRVPINEEFQTIAKFFYGAPVKTMDFTGHPARAVKSINKWVAKKTNQKITRVLSRADVKTNTDLVIVNAIFFRAFWSVPFNKATSAKFHLTKSRSINVDTMATTRRQFYTAYSKQMRCNIYRLPYVDNDADMYILLPKTAGDLTYLENHLKYNNLQKAIRQMKSWTGEIRLPKFKMSSSYDVAEVFRGLGVKDALGPGKLTLIASSLSSSIGLSNVKHKACIDVSETRTDAAAATAAITYRAGLFNFGPIVAINRPFLFIVKHRSGTILFVGRVLDPTSAV